MRSAVSASCFGYTTDNKAASWQNVTALVTMQGLVRLEDLVHKINDSLDNRVGANLQAISKMRLVDLPLDRSFTYEDFVATQAKFVKKQAEVLAVK